MKISKSFFLSLCIVLLGVILRGYRLEELFHFTYDEEVFAFIGRRMWVQGHIPLIGGVTPMHVHLAPYFYWLSGVILRLGDFIPTIWGAAGLVLAGITMGLIYHTGKTIFSPKVGLLAQLFYAVSFGINLYDRHYWGLLFNPLFSVIVFFCLWKIVRKEKWYFYILALTLSVAFHFDPSTLVLYLVSFFVLLYRRVLTAKFILSGIAIFVAVLAPLIAFDIRHKGENIRGWNQYLKELKTQDTKHSSSFISNALVLPKTLARTLAIDGPVDLAEQYSYCKPYVSKRLNQTPPWAVGITIIIFVTGAWYLYKRSKKEKNALSILYIYFFSVLVGITIYGTFFGGDLFDHYLTTALPLFALLVGFVFTKNFNRFMPLAFILGMLFILSNISSLHNAYHSYGYTTKKEAIDWVQSHVGETPFSLESLGSCYKFMGYRYLFAVHGREPVKSYVDQNFFYVFDTLPAEKHPPITVVMVNKSNYEDAEFASSYNHFLGGAIQKKAFGGFEVLIIDNTSGKYDGNF